MVVWIAIHCLIGLNPYLDDLVSSGLGVPEGAIGRDPPFYIIRRVFVRWITCGIGFAATLVLVITTWKTYRLYSGMVLWLRWVWSLPAVMHSVMIEFRTTHLLDPRLVTSEWSTHSEYIRDPMRWIVFLATAFLVLPIARLNREHENRMNPGPAVDQDDLPRPRSQ